MPLEQVSRALVQRLRRPAPWLGYALFVAVYFIFQGSAGLLQGSTLPILLAETLGAATMFWAITFLAPIPWQWSGRGSRRPSFPRGCLQSFLFCEALLGALVLLTALAYRLSGKPFPWLGYAGPNMGLGGALMILLGSLQARREAEEADKHEARSEARAAQTRLLQSQLHPHVLFNALNGLAELIRKDPGQAEASVKSLSDLLRRLLVASEESRVDLAGERKMVEDYLDIEGMRLGDRLSVAWDWDPSLDAVQVIPLLVQPLVENAIKHGISPHLEGGRLGIRAAREAEGLLLEVRNTGMELRPAAPGRQGIGMKNLRSRLDLAYGDRASFTLGAEGGWVVARISISMAELAEGEVSHARGPGR